MISMRFLKAFFRSFLFVLTVPLAFGMQGANILVLQHILNTDVQAHIPETGYFGPLTLAAVKTYQAENSLPTTGYVGPLTLAALNSVASSTTPPNIYATDEKIQSIQDSITSIVNTALAQHTTPQIDPSQFQTTLADAVIITNISTHTGFAGGTISIAAQNLDPFNTVYFCSPSLSGSGCSNLLSIPNISGTTGTLTFTLPAFPAGRYDVAIENSHGLSNTTFFIILSGNTSPVSVFSITPNAVRWGSTVIISGTSFTPTGNEVVTTFDTIKNVPSADGKTLSVKIAPAQLQEDAALGTGTNPIPDSIAVINANGYTSATNFSINI